MSLIRKTLAVSSAVLGLFGATVAVAQSIVVRASGPSAQSYPAGKTIAANARIALSAGDTVTIVDAGGTRVLRGPGVFTPSGPSARAGSGFGQLLSNTGARQARTGATRSGVAGDPSRSPSVWLVDASKSGTMCLTNAYAAGLWRPGTAAGTLSLTRLSDNKAVKVNFAEGQAVKPWPIAELPIAGGGEFRISGDFGTEPNTIRVVMTGEDPRTLDGAAALLIKNGCENQLNLLVETTSRS